MKRTVKAVGMLGKLGRITYLGAMSTYGRNGDWHTKKQAVEAVNRVRGKWLSHFPIVDCLVTFDDGKRGKK